MLSYARPYQDGWRSVGCLLSNGIASPLSVTVSSAISIGNFNFTTETTFLHKNRSSSEERLHCLLFDQMTQVVDLTEVPPCFVFCILPMKIVDQSVAFFLGKTALMWWPVSCSSFVTKWGSRISRRTVWPYQILREPSDRLGLEPQWIWRH